MAEKQPLSRRTQEIIGVALFACAVFLFLSLISYNSSDPSFSRYETGDKTALNWMGLSGSYTADLLLRALGISACWLPVFLLLTAIKLFRNEDFRVGVSWAAGLSGLVLATAGLLANAYNLIPLFGTPFGAGGMAGTVLSAFLNSLLNPVGTLIFLGVLLTIALIVTIDLSVVTTTKKGVRITRNTGRWLTRWFLIAREKLRNRKRAMSEKIKERAPKGAPVILIDAAPAIEKPRPQKADHQESFDFIKSKSAYNLPPLTLLDDVLRKDTKLKRESLIMNSRLLEKKLADFGVEGKVVEVRPGPVITMYELEPAPGVKINKIANLSDDLALALKAPSIRIIAPIPGKAVIGIEIPNHERERVHLRDALDNEDFLETRNRLPIALGEDAVGAPVIADLTRMPHLLIAGTTGSGKSVFLNALICSILFKAHPDEVKFLMIDPKRLELSAYEGIPHLLHPVVVNPKEASMVLRWAVQEMEQRYRIIGETGTKSIEKFNKFMEREQALREKPLLDKEKPKEAVSHEDAATAFSEARRKSPERLPYIVIVIDELADLMMVAQRNVEESLTRLAQMARAAGIHLILATQRPSVDVITGIIKANFPTRISFQVSSKVDSRTILDQLGAEQLLGSGDMLFMPTGTSKLVRIHGAYVSEKEISKIVGFVKKQGNPVYDEFILKVAAEPPEGDKPDGDFDEKYDDAVELVTDLGQASISLVQRYLKVGYNRAARIIEKMEQEGIVGASDGVKPRKVLAKKLPR
jgi:DNA segregation ATPase FtsK/SpoIIIE, S-DNA-T family